MPNNNSHTIVLGEEHEETPLGIRFASRAIITREGEILLMHEIVGDQWMLPGGGCETGETPEECCIREVAEETGLEVRPVHHLLTLDEGYGNRRYISDYFVCEVLGQGEPNLTEEEKELGTESRWMSFDQANDIFSTWVECDPLTSRYGLYLREFTALQEYDIWKINRIFSEPDFIEHGFSQ